MLKLSEIRNEIESFVKKEYFNSHYEIEVKFGIYKKYFLSSVNPIFFDRLKKKLNFQEVEVSTVSSDKEYRKIEVNHKEIWQIKSKINDYEFREYNLRLSVNKETTLSDYQVPDQFEPLSIRERSRWKHCVEDKFELSLTIVRDSMKKLYDTSYEIEIELLNFKYFNEFEGFIEKIYCLLYETNIPFKISERNLLNAEIGSLLNHEQHKKAKIKMENNQFRFGPFIYKSVLVEPRNIKKDDICYDGFFSKHGPYTITHKADGVRRLLIIHSTGMWLVLPPYEFNLVLRPNDNKLYQKIFQNKIFVLDGELTTIENSKYYYLVFDCLSIGDKNHVDIQFKTLSERLNCVQKFFIDNLYQLTNKNITPVIQREIEKIKPIIQIEIKESSSLSKLKIHDQIDQFVKRKPKYKTDGYIITPLNCQYNPFSQLEKTDRTLRKFPDVCKWKPPHEITIDFIIERNDGKIIIYYAKEFYDQGPELIQFSGSVFYPDYDVDHENPMTLNVRNGLVVEYYWDYANKMFKPKGIRYDKQSANRRKVVMNNWNDIMDPIRLEDMTGKTLKTVFWYHNRIKKNLYQLIEKGSNILDIGSGAGGDINKWKHNFLYDSNGKSVEGKNKIIAVEPLSEHIELMKNRIKNIGMDEHIHILQNSGQDSNVIINTCKQIFPTGKADVITLMLSLSFFWRFEKDLNELVNTIVNTLAPNGKILFMTIDGQRLNKKIKNDELIIADLASFKIQERSNDNYSNKLSIKINESVTASEQEEYLVFIPDLTQKLAQHNIKLMEFNCADEERLFTEEQSLYSSLYSYGYYQLF